MESTTRILCLINVFTLILCGYPPTGDEVLSGSVLLPATRRGRYLANIVRRQAVDGTGIKFNKDADRMNAEAKKKVDVLSEELLPYIIAEQERRTTLYKRVMTAIQNGEKGVTVAEIRNKPPLIIRKGLMFRCPANRAPKEPDGSGILMCEDNIEPTPVMYDSCLSAEDKELYVAENKYFFCNRHKVEGPDLPRNGSSVIGCAPIERTSLNYTSGKCALEDTDDVVVHYRYYPDKTYKFVTELDPDHEVCDHWNPCQIGYIYSLPSPDQALPANELWHEYNPDEYEQIISQDSIDEYVYLSNRNYTTSPRRILVPDGYTFDTIQFTNQKLNMPQTDTMLKTVTSSDGRWITITITFSPLKPQKLRDHYVKFVNNKHKSKVVPFLNLIKATISLINARIEVMPGQNTEDVIVSFKCSKCHVLSMLVRSADGNVYNLERNRYMIRGTNDGRKEIAIDVASKKADGLSPKDVGDYFAIFQNDEGNEERIKVLTVHSPVLKVPLVKGSTAVGGHYDQTVNYSCEDCEVKDVLCNGASVLTTGRVSVVPHAKMISFNFPRFEDTNSCVYLGFFKMNGEVYKKIIAVIDTAAITQVPVISPPNEGQQFEQEILYTCEDCTVEKVMVNGIVLEPSSARRSGVAAAFYVVTESSIIIRISEYNNAYEGVYQAVFNIGGEHVTKTIMEIRDPADAVEDAAAPETTVAADAATDATEVSEAASEASEAASEAGEATSEAASEAPAETTTEAPAAR